MKEIKVPELAESITEGTISEWLVKVGDTVNQGDPILELETDKVNLEVNTDYAGVITEILSEEGEDVEVGDVIAKVDESGEGAAPSESSTAEDAKQEHEKKKKKKHQLPGKQKHKIQKMLLHHQQQENVHVN